MLIALVLACSGASLDDSGADEPVRFGFPLPERERFYAVIGVDHDPEVNDDSLLGGAVCTNFDGEPFPACYDEHDGTDYMLEGSFEAMDAGSSPVVAAADGVVVSVADGNYDRCHVEDFQVTCDGNPMTANHVKVRHRDGVESWYWHLKSGSVAVDEGDEVRCGDLLGLVGSSGFSSAPHLHFEVVDGLGASRDPYAGSVSGPESLWEDQDGTLDLPELGCVAER